jgi:hypothetical protein
MESAPKTQESAPNFVLEDVLDKLESKKIFDKYFAKNSKIDWIAQGNGKVYEGKPLVSDSFTQCTAIIASSKRSLLLHHIEPWNIRPGGLNNFIKYFPKDDPINIAYLTRDDSSPSTIDWKLKEEDWKIRSSKSIMLEQEKERLRWSIAVDPETNQVFVKYGNEGMEGPIKKMRLWGEYDHTLHIDSKAKFEASDYMPNGFRDVQKLLKERNYKLGELEVEEMRAGFDLNPRQWINRNDGQKRKLEVYHDGIMTEIDIDSQKSIAELIYPLIKGAKVMGLVKSMEYPLDEKYEQYDGFAFLYLINKKQILSQLMFESSLDEGREKRMG